MVRRVVALLVALSAGLLGAWLILTDSYPHEGPWLPLSASHGIHVGDVIIVALWLALAAGLWRWSRRGSVR